MGQAMHIRVDRVERAHMPESRLGITLQIADTGIPAGALPVDVILHQDSAELEAVLHFFRRIPKQGFSFLNRFRVPGLERLKLASN